MSDFSGFVAICPTLKGTWMLTADMPFDLTYGDTSTRIIIPRWFESDGPTIPALARPIFNPADARYMKAAIIHDWMLQQGCYLPRQSAAAFRDALTAAKVKAWQVRVMWIAVLIWTSRPWKEFAK
jgi:hypothetical protein